jgi:hypothetical protein
MALMANTHYLNATDEMFDGQSVVDVKFGDSSHPQPTVAFVAVAWTGFTIPHSSSGVTSDGWCTANQKLSFIMWTNHMHEYGSSELSEVARLDGTMTTMSHDTTWAPEQAFNAPWVRWDVASPMVVNPGDRFHVSCTWNNPTSADIHFPREMCVASGFALEAGPQVSCIAN